MPCKIFLTPHTCLFMYSRESLISKVWCDIHRLLPRVQPTVSGHLMSRDQGETPGETERRHQVCGVWSPGPGVAPPADGGAIRGPQTLD